MATLLTGLTRALTVLEELAAAGPKGLPIREIAAKTALDKAVVHRILATLKAKGYAEQNPESGDYFLGTSSLALADVYLKQDNLRGILHEAAVEVSAQSNELCHVGVPEGKGVRYIEKIEPDHSIRVVSHIGIVNPQATTSLGRAILAAQCGNRSELDAYLGQESNARVWDAVSQAHTQGFALEIEENEPGISCVGVALVRDGQPVAAMSLTVPADRMPQERQMELGNLLRSTLAKKLPPNLSIPAIY